MTQQFQGILIPSSFHQTSALGTIHASPEYQLMDEIQSFKDCHGSVCQPIREIFDQLKPAIRVSACDSFTHDE
jgi:hypothetical protein